MATLIKKSSTPSGNWNLRRAVDRIASVGVRAGGITIIVSMMLMLVLILLATLPLWRSPRIEVATRFSAKTILGGDFTEKIVAIGCEERRQLGYLLTQSGVFHFFNLATGEVVSQIVLPALSPATLSAAWQSLNGRKLALGTSDGRVLIGSIDFSPQYSKTGYRFTPAIDFSTNLRLDAAAQSIRCVTLAGDPGARLFVAGITADYRILTYAQETLQTHSGEIEKSLSRQQLPAPEARPTQVAVNDGLENLFIGCDNGTLIQYATHDLVNPTFVAAFNASNRALTTLGFLVGSRSLVVGDASGLTSIYFSILDTDARFGRRFRRAHQLPSLDGPIVVQAASARNRTYLASSAGGDLRLFFSTNERELFRGYLTDAPLALATFSPKADGLLLLDTKRNLYNVALDNPHPEASWKAFLRKIWYEGYERPEYVWQSTGGTDDFEAKLSLVPLIFGTLKGTFYAMLFALPLAAGSAFYVSQFMHVKWRNLVKTVVEMMATVPSVVLGFFAARWLAPHALKIMPGILLMIVALPLLTIIASLTWSSISRTKIGAWIKTGGEGFILIPLLLTGIWFCVKCSGAIEAWLFAGDFQSWLTQVAGLTYDQRNAFVVGLAMSFAVIPIIFTISEDALSNVPSSLTAASLALGATPWQTAMRAIVPTAAPGIFSAIMIGFGRAIGETMIVLMATGNTPLMDLSMFNGFRTLAANIAVEMPEAPVGGTLFRALFLAALALFLMAFVMNTFAEVVRQRMRERYGRL